MKTYDEIHYDLNGLCDFNECSEIYQRILKVLQKIPENVYDFVIEAVYFSDPITQVIRIKDMSKFKKQYIAIINKKASEFTIAHEIAHAWLGHKMFSEKSIEQEKQANEQARAWGFSE
jgi:Zn-dependent peptidase ImmA (M78 family)